MDDLDPNRSVARRLAHLVNRARLTSAHMCPGDTSMSHDEAGLHVRTELWLNGGLTAKK
jgi:hypothetical protein